MERVLFSLECKLLTCDDLDILTFNMTHYALRYQVLEKKNIWRSIQEKIQPLNNQNHRYYLSIIE